LCIAAAYDGLSNDTRHPVLSKYIVVARKTKLLQKPILSAPMNRAFSFSQLLGLILASTLASCQTQQQALDSASSDRQSTTSPPVLHLLTWEGYTPIGLVEEFEQATNSQVKITYVQDNGEILERLQAEQADYDLVYPLMSDVFVTQVQFDLYQPIALERVESLEQLIPAIAQEVARFTTTDRGQYALPTAWGTLGLIVNTAKVDRPVQSYQDICDPIYEGQVTYRLDFPTLAAAAYGLGYDPFSYIIENPREVEGWWTLMEASYYYLLNCQYNVEQYWDTHQDHANFMYDEEAIISLGWDSTGWLLNQVNPDIKFIIPQEGALGWISTLAITKQTDNLDLVYDWINFIYEPENAAKLVQTNGFLSPVQPAINYLPEAQKNLIMETFPPSTIMEIHWYPPRLPQFDQVVDEYLKQLRINVN
jgi:spermidine/putrescine transport system substrate-binding protein